MKKFYQAISVSARCLFAGLFVHLVLIYVVWILGKSLESLVPAWIVWILLAAAGIRAAAQRISEARKTP